ncbi:hypothetical protein PV10_04253 [Exophiala mesophila]|uniref:Zn(2)-C6 fungal-type domain-containing protein n=1 Tax=Exophiala mesophila TaxID=212818 RepID=A0A0D2A1X3_EXOME|nr:uncharacterized protein PV10_04253 [Exophiala mesophila]KIV93008.1 hypothetical protein PV10_04253 [Exophiala mesophila]
MSHPGSASGSPYHTIGSDHQQGPPRKKMRKGTKSCLECRRRKIKCNFEPGRPAVCNECYARGSTCIDQEHADVQALNQPVSDQSSSYSLRERVSQLEDLVKQVLHRLPEKEAQTDSSSSLLPDSNKSHLDAQAAEVLKSLKSSFQRAEPQLEEEEESALLPGGVRHDAPALSLFDNDVIKTNQSQHVVSRAQYNKNKALLDALRQLLPSLHDLEIILVNSHEWWTIWRQMFPEISDSRCETIKDSVSHSLRSDKPAEVAKIMLCIALGVHQLPLDFDWSSLDTKEEPSELMARYISTVDRLITSDDEIAATLEGIECMMLEAKHHINMGRPRRAWLLFHRAIAFAQLLGFHRLAARPDKTSALYRRQLNLWCHLIMGDRYLSLMLGLPYSVGEAYVAPYTYQAESPSALSTDEYAMKIIPIITKINDRNQAVVPMGYSATLRMDQELEELHNSQSEEWWSTELTPDLPPQHYFDRLQAQFYHHQTKLLLHMPFMLRSSTNTRYQYSHHAALEASREMIRSYSALRNNTSVGPFICKLVDFQSFTAAMLLLLNLCGYSHQHRGNQPVSTDHEQGQRDSELIDHTIQLLRDASKEPGGVVAAQCAQALEVIARARNGECDVAEQCRGEASQVSIPYFGTISIGPGKKFVPIKAGTYVTKPAGAKLPASSSRPAGASVVGNLTNSGLPTPPSMCSGSTQQSPMCSGSTQQSPMTGTLDRDYRSSLFETSANMVAPGTDTWPETDDPFVTFDSFMNFPQQVPGEPLSASVGGSSGFTPQRSNQSPFNGALNDFGMSSGSNLTGDVHGGQGNMQNVYPFGGFPFPQQTQSNLDLDQGWNWFGIDAPTLT